MLLTPFIKNVGFDKAAREKTLRVGAYVLRIDVLASVPAGETYTISHLFEDGGYERVLFIDGREWYAERYMPRQQNLASGKGLQPKSLNVHFRTADGERVSLCYEGYKTGPLNVNQHRSNLAPMSSLSMDEILKDQKNYMTLFDLVPGIQTTDPISFWGKRFYKHKVKILAIKPARRWSFRLFDKQIIA